MEAKRVTCLEQATSYIDGILSKNQGSLQVLLCDDTTRNVLSTVYTQNQLLKHQVVLVDMLGNYEDRFLMKHLKCVIFCRPTSRSIGDIQKELHQGNFSSYRVFFTYLAEIDQLQHLANSDVFDLVAEVGEVYLDTLPIGEYVSIVNLQPPELTSGGEKAEKTLRNPISTSDWDEETFARTSQAIVSSMLMTKRRPVIRFRKGNRVAQRLAEEVAQRMRSVHQGFPDLKNQNCVFVIVDRMDDPVTPLLTQWTYEAMIHEFIGFQRGNEVVVPGEGTVQDNTHILTPNGDGFYERNRYSNYGDICLAVNDLIQTYQALNNIDRKTASIEDIKNFVSNFPDAKKQSVQVTRHSSIIGHLIDETNSRNLIRLSELEQEMFVSSCVDEHSKVALELVRNPRTDIDDALRVSILYTLRYEKSTANIIAQLKTELEARGCPPQKLALMSKITQVAGESYRMHEVYPTSTGSKFKAAISIIPTFGNEVKNVLTQHQPLLKKIINRAYNGRLAESDYPVAQVKGYAVTSQTAATTRAKDVLIFMIGGVTCEEAMLVANINKGLVENNTEMLMNLGGKVADIGLGVGKVLTGGLVGGNGDAQQPENADTSKIEAHTVLLSTALINSKQFLRSVSEL